MNIPADPDFLGGDEYLRLTILPTDDKEDVFDLVEVAYNQGAMSLRQGYDLIILSPKQIEFLKQLLNK